MIKPFKNDSDNDLRLFLLWVNDLLTFYNITEYRLLNDCGLRHNFLAELRRQLRGKTKRRTKFSLYLILLVCSKYPFSMDLVKYSHLLGVSPNSIELKSIDSILTTYKTKKAANKLILTASV